MTPNLFERFEKGDIGHHFGTLQSAIDHMMESEVLFSRDSVFLVKSVENTFGKPIIYLQEVTLNESKLSLERSDAMRDVQELHQRDRNMQGVSERNTEGNTFGSLRPQSTSSAGQRDTIRSSGGQGTVLSAKSQEQISKQADLENGPASFMPENGSDNHVLQSTTNAVSQPLDSYSAEKQSMIKSFFNSADEKIKSFVEHVKNGDLTFRREKISDVNERTAEDIKNLLDIDVTGYTHNINTNGVRHILNRHGENGVQDSSMSAEEDIARVGWVLENYDLVELIFKDGEQVYSSEFNDTESNPAPQIRFVKKIDGTYYVVEAAYENNFNKLWVQSAYLVKNKEDVTQAVSAGNADQDTNARSALPSPSSNTNVSQNEPDVNSSIFNSSDNYSQNLRLQSNANEGNVQSTGASGSVSGVSGTKNGASGNVEDSSTDNSTDGSGEFGFRKPDSKGIYRKSTDAETAQGILTGKRIDAEQRHINDIVKKLDKDLKLVWVDGDAEVLCGKKGRYDRDTNTMYMSRDTTLLEKYYEVFKHEFVHRLESKKAYQSFKKYLLEKSVAFENNARAKLREIYPNENFETREDVIVNLREWYYSEFMNDEKIKDRFKKEYKWEDADYEMVSDFVAQTLFKGKEKVRDIAQSLADEDINAIKKIESDLDLFAEMATDNRNLLQKVIDAIKDFINNLKHVPQNKSLVEDLEYIEQRLSRVYASKDTKKAADMAPKVEFAIAGKKANTANHNKLIDAIRRVTSGEDSESVRRVTGWYKGPDGKWRYYIPDNELNVDKLAMPDFDGGKLGDYIIHDKLFEAYPQLKDVNVRYVKFAPRKKGEYLSNSKEIFLNNNLRNHIEKIKDTLVHEIQHAIQDIEGFAPGGNKSVGLAVALNWAYDKVKDTQEFNELDNRFAKRKYITSVALEGLNAQSIQELQSKIYRAIYGEVESRDVTSKRKLDADALRDSKPDTDGLVIDIEKETTKFVENFTEMGYTEEEILNIYKGDQNDISGSNRNFEGRNSDIDGKSERGYGQSHISSSLGGTRSSDGRVERKSGVNRPGISSGVHERTDSGRLVRGIEELNSQDSEDYSDISDIKGQFPSGSPLQRARENLNKYELGEMTREEYAPYRVTINVKEKSDGEYVSSFSAEKQREFDTPRTLHAVVNDGNNPDANVKLSDNKVTQNTPIVKNNISEDSEDYSIPATSNFEELLEAYENGDISRQEYLDTIKKKKP